MGRGVPHREDLPGLLGVTDVLNRYGLKDRRAARRIMDTVGAFKLGANLYVRAGDLAAHEEALIAARRGEGRAGPANDFVRPHGKTHAKRGGRTVRAPLQPDWWREPLDDASLGAPTNAPGSR